MRFRNWCAVRRDRARRDRRCGWHRFAAAAVALAAQLLGALKAEAAGNPPGAPLGSVVAVRPTNRGVQVDAAGGSLRIEFVDTSIVRLTASRSPAPASDTGPHGAVDLHYRLDRGRAPLPARIVPSTGGWTIAPAQADAIAVAIRADPFELRVVRPGQPEEAPLLATASGEGWHFRAGRTEGRFVIQDNEHFIGFGAHRHPLDMRGRSIVLTTSELGREGEGGGFPVPWVMSSRGYGLLLNNVDPTTRFDLGETRDGHLVIDAGDGDREGWNFDLYLVAGESFASLMQGYIHLTGSPILAEKWFFGNMQSKCCDWRAEDVIYIASRFRALQLPLEAMILDLQWRELRADMWEWTPAFDETEFDGKRNNLNWEPSFGDPGAMFRVLDELGVKLGLHENTTSTYAEDPGPGPYFDRSFPDLSQPGMAGRLWAMHRPLVAQGADFWWQDQGERIRGIGASGYPMTNLNGALWAKLVAEGMRREFGLSVPVIARSGPVGGHRYISPWPGDVPAGLPFARFDLDYIRNGGLAGYATIGADLGGFYHGHTPDAQNEVRRITDMFLVFPVIRTHGAYYKLPWMFSGEAQAIYARYLQLRYRLLPYIYSAAIEAHETGRPILTPLCFDFAEDETTYQRDFDFLLGRDLLVAPIIEPTDRREVYLPEGQWRNFWSDAPQAGGRMITVDAPLGTAQSLPMFVKEGAILPMTAPALTIPSRLFERYTFHAYPAAGRTDRRSFKDRARALDESQVISTEMSEDSGRIALIIEGAPSVETLYFHGPSKPTAVSLNGRLISEQTMGATSTGWSHGPSDFPLQEGATVLKVQLASGDAMASERIECVVHKD